MWIVRARTLENFQAKSEKCPPDPIAQYLLDSSYKE